MESLNELKDYNLVVSSAATIRGKSVGLVSLTKAGKAYLEARNKEQINRWIPYVITTLIAIAAIIISIAK